MCFEKIQEKENKDTGLCSHDTDNLFCSRERWASTNKLF